MKRHTVHGKKTTPQGSGVIQEKNQKKPQPAFRGLQGIISQKIELIHGPIPNVICTLGLTLNRECHLKTYTSTVGLYSYADLQSENMLLLLITCQPKADAQDRETICFHHEKSLPKYNLQQMCLIHSKNHKNAVGNGVR